MSIARRIALHPINGMTEIQTFTIADLDGLTPITRPQLEDCQRLVDELSRGHYIRSAESGEPLPAISGFHHDGVAAVVFSRESAARRMASEIADAYELETAVSRVTGLWDFLHECASCGYQGAILDHHYPVTFHNRISDMNRRVPTLMMMRFPASENDLRQFFFSRFDIVQPQLGTTINWVDYEKLDKASKEYALQGDPLPEEIDPHAILGTGGTHVQFKDGATFLGPYVADMGAIPVFTQEKWALEFAGILGFVEPTQGEHSRLARGLAIESIDLPCFLDAVETQSDPFIDIGLNPLAHRFRQGWFFHHKEGWMMETISGVWQVLHDGQLVARHDVQPHKRHLGMPVDSALLTWGVSTVVHRPFKRLTGADRATLSDEDANALLDSELSKPIEPQVLDPNTMIPVDAFVVDAFSRVTGDYIAALEYGHSYGDSDPMLGFLVFPDMIAAVRYILHSVLPFDEQIRVNGYAHAYLMVPGSNDADAEARRTSSASSALRKTLFDALTKGYRPEHSLHVMRLVRDVTATFEPTEVGYFGDLLFYGTMDGGALEDRLDPEEALKRLKKINAARDKLSAGFTLPVETVARLRSALGQTYQSLEPESRVVAVTLLEEFDRVGMRPNYDYAGISMKASKLVERELGARVFRPWRDQARKELGRARLSELAKQVDEPPIDQTDHMLIRWLQKRSKLDLGTMRFCLRHADQQHATTAPRQLLARYLNTLPQGAWLMSEEFESDLDDISTKYRNGGVHEHLVGFETCREAVSRILLGERPLLRRLMEAT